VLYNNRDEIIRTFIHQTGKTSDRREYNVPWLTRKVYKQAYRSIIAIAVHIVRTYCLLAAMWEVVKSVLLRHWHLSRRQWLGTMHSRELLTRAGEKLPDR